MFFREICASKLNVEKLRHLEASMPITLCKLEMVFPSSLFNSMEHLPIHLAYEAKVGGPQQYRWMYLFEMFLCSLKEKIKNPRYVEGSIAEAFLVEEATNFASYYYPPKMISRWRGAPRNDDSGETSDQTSIFNFPGRVVGKYFRSTLEGSDKSDQKNPLMSDSKVKQFRNSEFHRWLQSYFVHNREAPHDVAWSLSYGAATVVTLCKNM
ncbi:hypothetical protein K1719_017081 [Acacia pycnantha]|nr:hypothetical protein K1719_017081 [Acacia pycnantha]